VDALVALTLGTSVIMATAQLMTSAAVAANSSRETNLAYNAARQALENARLYKGAKLASTAYPDAAVFGPIPQKAQLSDCSVSMSVADYDPPVKIATVRVTWTSASRMGGKKERTLTALVTPCGVTP